MNVDLQHFPDFKLMEINRTCTRLESFGWRLHEWSRKNARETVYITAKRWLKTAAIYLRNGDLFQKRKSRQRFLLAGEKKSLTITDSLSHTCRFICRADLHLACSGQRHQGNNISPSSVINTNKSTNTMGPVLLHDNGIHSGKKKVHELKAWRTFQFLYQGCITKIMFYNKKWSCWT